MRTVAKTGRLMERSERNMAQAPFGDLDPVAVAEVEAAAGHDLLARREALHDLDAVAGRRPRLDGHALRDALRRRRRRRRRASAVSHETSAERGHDEDARRGCPVTMRPFTKSPALSDSSAFGTSALTFTVRLASSAAGLMNETLPANSLPGKASLVKAKGCPTFIDSLPGNKILFDLSAILEDRRYV